MNVAPGRRLAGFPSHNKETTASNEIHITPQSSTNTMLPIDPELAALLGPIDPRVQAEEPTHVPTIAEARAYCEAFEVAPSKAYHKPLLPPGEFLSQERAPAVC